MSDQLQNPSLIGSSFSAIAAYIYQVVRASRFVIGYLSFTATLFSGIALILKRQFVEAALLYLAEFIGSFHQVLEFANVITAFWDEWLVEPLQSYLLSALNFAPPVWIIEVGTLIFFALGPIIRAVWTTRVMKTQIARRLVQYDQLSTALNQQDQRLAELKQAIANKNWDRVKAAGGMAGSAALGIAGALLGQTGGHSARNIQISYEALKSSFSGWKEAKQEIDTLEVNIGQLRTETTSLGAADGGLLQRLQGAAPELVTQEISAFVRRRMGVPILLSRVALGLALAVVLAYIIDWTL